MLNHYVFKECELKVGQRKSDTCTVKIEVDIHDDDPYAPPPPKDHYINGMRCHGELKVEVSNTSPSHLRKMLEASLTLKDQGDSTKIQIVLLEMLDSQTGIKHPIEGRPPHTKIQIWSFFCNQIPASDGLGIFPKPSARSEKRLMKVFVFTRFPGWFNSERTSAVIVAESKQAAVTLLSNKLEERGLARLVDGGYAVVEVDPTCVSAVIAIDGSE